MGTESGQVGEEWVNEDRGVEKKQTFRQCLSGRCHAFDGSWAIVTPCPIVFMAKGSLARARLLGSESASGGKGARDQGVQWNT